MNEIVHHPSNAVTDSQMEDGKVLLESDDMSLEEIEEIVITAEGGGRGNARDLWFRCVTCHPYSIGECGGATATKVR